MDLPRVSQILAPYSGYNKVPKKILEKAAERGTAIHKACHALTLKETTPEVLPKEWAPYLLSWMYILPQIKIVHSCEKTIENVSKGYKGTYDYVFVLNEFDGLVLLDIKTSYAKKDIWGAQLAAYKQLLYGEGVDIQHVMVAHLDKQGKAPKMINYTEKIDDYMDDFEAMRKMYHKYQPDQEDFFHD